MLKQLIKRETEQLCFSDVTACESKVGSSFHRNLNDTQYHRLFICFG